MGEEDTELEDMEPTTPVLNGTQKACTKDCNEILLSDDEMSEEDEDVEE